MSIDFDSGALQTQQNDNEEFDQEDYAREQLLQQLLTDLPHDMLDDSLCSTSEHNYSDCSDHELPEPNEHWDRETHWADGRSDHQNQYKNAYLEKPNAPQYIGHQRGPVGNQIHNGWGGHNAKEEDMFPEQYDHHREPANEESNVGSFHGVDHYEEPDQCSTSDLYHLPEDFQPYTKTGHQPSQNFLENNREQIQRFGSAEGNGGQSVDSVPVRYNPYPINGAHKDVVNTELTRKNDNYDDLQREFLDTGECTASNMQFVQLQVLYKARGRQLEEINAKLEEGERQLRYLNHQLAIVKDEKDGLAISLQESHTLLQNSREMELQLRGQIAALQNTVDGLTSNDEQLRKELKVAKLAMESMQQQVMDLRRSDSINRAREQHEAVVSVLKKKNEEQVLSLQQKLDDVGTALQEQKDISSRLEEQLKQTERKLEESKLEKTEMINRLSRSLEESQKQCASLLQTGSIPESVQLRMQLQQLQTSKTISDHMNKALQDELKELKEQITMYESAADLGVFVKGEEQEQLSDSYVDLGIKKVNWQKSQFQRSLRTNGLRKDLSSEDIVTELKAELERCMTSNKAKRQQIVQLQSDLKSYQLKTEELKNLLEKDKDYEAESGNTSYRSTGDRDRVIQSLQEDKQKLQQEIEKKLLQIKELAASEEKLKAANQQLCIEMREMIQDFDKDKKESIERCERTYDQHHEDIKNRIITQLTDKFESEKAQQFQTYEAKIAQLQSQIGILSNEMTAVQECYIAVCKEKDSLEDVVRESMRREFAENEEKSRAKLLEDKECSLQSLRKELEEQHQAAVAAARTQLQKENAEDLKRQIDIQLAMVKEDWVKKQEHVTSMKIQAVESQWKQKLDSALKLAKETLKQSSEDHAVQTDQSPHVLDIEQLEVKLQNALLDKERAVQEACQELERKHQEDLSYQVELALTRARTKWLQELTSLSEYKINLQFEKEKWEKLNSLNVKQQISDAVSAAEEKWRLESEKSEHSVKQKETEVEEQLAALRRELDLKTGEFEAQMKVELGKARSQWSKEKQEEIQAIQAQNEKDFRSFLDDHRTKISDVLSTAKADFEKQKNEIIAQKEAELTEQFNKSLKLWNLEESRRMQDHDSEILSQIEYLMSEIHDELVEKRVTKESLRHETGSLDLEYCQKLKSCLQRSVKRIAYKVLSNAKQELKQKPDENELNCVSNTSSRGQERPCIQLAEAEMKSKMILTERMENGNLQKVSPADARKKRKNYCSESCSENCLQQLEKSKKECQELRHKLDKACRHLQQAVKEQKLRTEQFKVNEIVLQNLRKENVELQKKLEEKLGKSAESLSSEKVSEKGCDMCRGKVLEEMRAQYIKAVDKIKNDMLRYIHESKGRAAEMLKAEVLRERQETARKMRKYYLTCLQQLLKDDGKNEGAEKKIMSAASKLATMAKVLETPVSQKTQSRNLQAAPASAKIEAPLETGKSLQNVEIYTTDHLTVPNTEQRTIDELIRRHMKEKLDGGRFPSPDTLAMKPNNGSKQLQKDSGILEPSGSLAIDKSHTLNCTNLNAEGSLATFHGQAEPSFLHNLKGYEGQDCRTKSSKPRFELQETPVRDSNGSNDWTSVTGKGLLKQSSVTSITMQSHNQDTSRNFSAPGLFSHVEGSHDNFGSRYEGQNHSAHIAKKRDHTPSTRHSSKIVIHPPTGLESKPYSDVGRGGQLPSRKLLLDFTSPQQDSGFNSPFPNINSFN
ncbi:centrosomal protein of 152 kDa [Gastrophryne carolinensis]